MKQTSSRSIAPSAQQTLFGTHSDQPAGKSISVYRVSLVKDATVSFGQFRVSNSQQAHRLIQSLILTRGQPDREQFVVALLNTKNDMIGLNIVSVGGLSSATAHPREVLKPAILANSAAMICSFSFLAGAAFAGYLVSGAPEPYTEANGLYCETVQTSEEDPLYEKDGGEWAMLHYTDPDPPYWVIASKYSQGYGLLFANDANGPTPPLTGWYLFLGEHPPVPSIVLSEQSCAQEEPKAEAVPTITEWGLIALSFLLIVSAAWFIRKRKGIN